MAGAFVAGAIVSSLILDTKKWSSSVSKVNADQAKMAGMSEKTAGKFRKVGAGMTIVGAAIVAGVAKSIQAFGDFDQAMIESTSIMGDLSAETRRQMEQTALEMSGQSKFAAKELGEAYFFLASAGLDAEESIGALPLVTSFATAGAFDLASATDLLTDAQSALGLTVDDTAQSQENMLRVSDVLVKANTLANAKVQEFSEALTNKAGAAMRAYGIEVEEGVAVLAAFADQGTKGRDAGTQFSIVLRELQKAALQNKEAFKEAGIAVYDANGNINNMGDIVAQLEDRLGSMSPEMRKAELSTLGFSEKSQMALLTLVGTSGAIREYETELRAAGGITEEVSSKQMLSFNNQMTMAKNKMAAAAITIGEQLAPTIVSLATAISNTVGKISEWARANPALFSTITKIVAGAGALMAVLGPMVMMLPRMVAGLKLAAAGVKVLGVAFKTALGPIGLVTAAIVAAGVALNSWINAKKKALDADMAAMVQENKLGDALKARKQLIEANVITQEEWTALVNKHGRDYKRVMLAIDKNPAYKNLKDKLVELNKSQVDAIEGTEGLGGAAGDAKPPIDSLGEAAGNIIQPLEGADQRVLALNKSLADGTITVSEYFKQLNLLDNPLAQLQERIENMPMDDALEGVESYVAEWESVPDATQSVFAQIGLHSLDSQTEIEKHAETMKTNVTSIWSDMADGLKTKWASTLSEFVMSGEIFKGDFTGLWDGLKTQFFDIVGQMAAKIATGLFDVIISGAADAAKSLLGSLGSALGGGAGDVAGGLSSVTGALQGAMNPIGMISGAVTAIASVASLFKKAGPSSTDSWHFEHIWINTKELRDYTFMNIGGSGGWLAKIHDKTNQVVLKNEYQMKQNRKLIRLFQEKTNVLIGINGIIATATKNSADLLGKIRKDLSKVTGAQAGHTAKKPELVMMHGSPANPEHAIPDDRLRDLLSMADAASGGGRGDVSLQSDQQVNFNGLMISDRDYMRQRGIPELLAALKANVGLAELKSIVGVT